MPYEFDQGQDDLIKEDKFSETVKNVFKRKRDHIATNHDLVIDRGRPTSASRGPEVSRRNDRPATEERRAKRSRPKRIGFKQLRSMWHEAVRDAEIKQQQRRSKRGK